MVYTYRGPPRTHPEPPGTQTQVETRWRRGVGPGVRSVGGAYPTPKTTLVSVRPGSWRQDGWGVGQ